VSCYVRQTGEGDELEERKQDDQTDKKSAIRELKLSLNTDKYDLLNVGSVDIPTKKYFFSR